MLLALLIVKPITYIYFLAIFSQLFLLHAVAHILLYGDDDYVPAAPPYTNLDLQPIPKLPKPHKSRKRRSKLSGARTNNHILSIIKEGSL